MMRNWLSPIVRAASTYSLVRIARTEVRTKRAMVGHPKTPSTTLTVMTLRSPRPLSTTIAASKNGKPRNTWVGREINQSVTPP